MYDGRNTILAKEGKGFRDGDEVLNMIKFKIEVEKIKNELPIIGRRSKSNKTSGLKYKGTIVEYRATSTFAQMIKEYKETGIDVYFDMQGVQDDPSSGLGAERIVVKGCNIDGAVLMNIDIETEDSVKDEISFTFEDFDIIDAIG